MGTWKNDTIRTGAVAATATTAVAAVLGHLENGSAVAPINAVSHILWGDEATTEAVDARHTLAGMVLNAASVTAWAGLHEALLPRHRPSMPRALASGMVTAAVAYVTDYHVVPKRFTPGFEKELSPKSLFGIYATLALALAVGSLCR
ncbi:MAG: hypothetical protein ACOH13_05460 [Flavobacteriales bacterium]